MVPNGRARLLARVGALCLAVVLAGCGVPIPPELPDTSAPRAEGGSEGAVDRLIPSDDGSVQLIDALRLLEVRVAEARDLLQDADVATERADGTVRVLLGPAAGGTSPGVLPAIEPDRAGAGSDDLITALITRAGDVGGERSRIVLELVRDPMLGDLVAWQRDPVGVIAALRAIGEGDAARGAASLDAALLELPGELTRALGYAFAAAASEDPAVVAHAATQGAGRLGVVLVALELANERLGAAA